MKQLLKVLKGLKKGKARDPLNLVNEIFRPEVAGSDMLLALLKIVNAVREQQEYPTKLKYADITSVYKGKGSKSDMDNQRGFFNLGKPSIEKNGIIWKFSGLPYPSPVFLEKRTLNLSRFA
jgi:hypothetical protein